MGPDEMMLKGRPTHRRTINSKYGTSSVAWLRRHVDRDACILRTLPKHKYLIPLDAEVKTLVEKLRKPYPRCAVSKEALRLDTIQQGAVRI